jgi:hypothetical protein
VKRRIAVVALVAGGLGLLAAFDVTLAAIPAFGLSAAAAWLLRL